MVGLQGEEQAGSAGGSLAALLQADHLPCSFLPLKISIPAAGQLAHPLETWLSSACRGWKGCLGQGAVSANPRAPLGPSWPEPTC